MDPVPELDQDPGFVSATDVADRLRLVDYLPDDKIAGTVYLAERLFKPILVEGPAGTGKTELAKSIAKATNARLIRLQCYEGLDEAKALYEWDYRKQLLHIQSAAGTKFDENDIFSEDYLLTRPLLEAIRAEDQVVLLVDEVDRLDIETEALLLEVLSDYQVSIPELGTIVARRKPLVFLTSNNSRELSEALKRRCLFLHIDYPSAEREREIILARVPGISDRLATQVAEIVRSLRSMDLKKPPSVSETLDWAQTLVILATDVVTDQELQDNLHVLLKNQGDIAVASKRFGGLSA
jgi:MoxR-like ATPase